MLAASRGTPDTLLVRSAFLLVFVVTHYFVNSVGSQLHHSGGGGVTIPTWKQQQSPANHSRTHRTVLGRVAGGSRLSWRP